MSKLPSLLWFVAAAILLIALLKLPYGYYTFTRIVVCAFCAAVAYLSAREGIFAWATALGLVAVVFNPLIPIYLKRDIWFWIDIGAAALILAHFFFVRRGHAATALGKKDVP